MQPVRRWSGAFAFLFASVAVAHGAARAQPLVVGCADGTREGFVDLGVYATIAACGGAWDVPGAFHDEPSCGRQGGNDGVLAAGGGCNVEDLCAGGWHVCYGPDDINIRTGGRGCVDAVASSYPQNGTGPTAIAHPPGAAFFMTRTSGSGTGNCDEVVNGFPQSFNDIFGCGNMGSPPQANCTPLNRFGHNQCSALHSSDLGGASAQTHGYTSAEWAWECNDHSDGTNESKFVVKSRDDDQGGVLCCKDSDGSLPEVCDGVDNDSDALADEVDFVHDGTADEFPGDPCTQTNGQPGTILCTGAGGWTCGPIAAQACCLPDGRCADRAPAFCAQDGGLAGGGGSRCAATLCPQPASASIAGRVWHDVDVDGLEDTGEPGLAGVTVRLDVDADGVPGVDRTLTATSGADGGYKFGALDGGTYTLRVDATDAVLAAGGFRATTPFVGGNPATYSEASPLTIVIAAGQAVAGLDFGFVGGCLATTAPGTACDDRDACTSGDACVGGACLGQSMSCDDGNPCTDDACTRGQGCLHANNDAACSDGSDCTGGDHCAAGACQPGATPLCAPSCPNGQLDAGEACDDNNAAAGDGCDATCQLEYDYPCEGTPAACVLCGDQTVDAGEQCDDGNHVAGDGCDASCKSEDPCFGSTDVDHDGVCDGGDPCIDNDHDGFGVGQGCAPDCDDAVATCNVDCVSDRNGGDGDGVPDCAQAQCADEDGDGFGVGDGCAGLDCDDREPMCAASCANTDGDGLADCLDPDDDNDGLVDTGEAALHTDPTNADSDGDGVGDNDEVAEHHTSPTNPDSDGDGMKDGEELAAGRDPVDPGDATVTSKAGDSGCAATDPAGLAALAAALAVLIGARRRRFIAR